MSFLSPGRTGNRLRAVLDVAWRLLGFLAVASLVGYLVGWLLAPFRGPGVSDTLLATIAGAVGVLTATWAMATFVERIPLAAVGLHGGRRAWRQAAGGALLGAGIMAGACIALLAVGWMSLTPDEGALADGVRRTVAVAAFLLPAAVTEELLFRGYPFQLLVRRAGVPITVLLTSVLFALAHLFNPEITPLAVVNLGLAGVLLAVAYLKTRSLWFPIGLHAGWNLALAVPFDQPVSGIPFDLPGFDVREVGPDLFTGGGFGPEGGLVATGVTLGTAVWLARTRRVGVPGDARAAWIDRRAPAVPAGVGGEVGGDG